MKIQPNPAILASTRSIGIEEMNRLVELSLARAKNASIDMKTRREYASDALAYQMKIDAEKVA